MSGRGFKSHQLHSSSNNGNEEFQVIFTDLSGLEITKFSINESEEINISNLASGMYIVTIQLENNEKISGPFIKLQ